MVIINKKKKIRNYSSEDKLINNFIDHEHEIKIKKHEEFLNQQPLQKNQSNIITI